MPPAEKVLPSKAGNAPVLPSGWVEGHPDDGVLHAGLDDQLSASESALVADHVSRCASCRGRAADAHGAIAGARRIVKRVKEAGEGALLSPNDAELSSLRVASNAKSATDIAQSVTVKATTTAAGAAGVPSPAHSRSQPSAAAAAPQVGAVKSTVKSARLARFDNGLSAFFAKFSALTNLPWARTGGMAAVVIVVASGVLVWRSLDLNLGQSATGEDATSTKARTPTPPRERDVPVATPSRASDSVPAAAIIAQTAPDSASVATGASVGSTVPVPVVAAAPHSAAFDSLVLTRQSCASQCTDFTFSVSQTGSLHYAIRTSGGRDQSGDAVTTDASLLKMSALISGILFETLAVPASGRSVCTVFDETHAPALRLMVAHGSSSALHANSCSASSKVLLQLGAQLDSLAGGERLRQSLLHSAK